MSKNTKKMKDVQTGDVLYRINKIYLTEGIEELTVTETGVNESSGESWFIPNDSAGCYYIPKSSMSKTFISTYDAFIATSVEGLLKVAGKFVKKNLDNYDIRIAKMKEDLDNLIEGREKVYRLYIDVMSTTK